VVSLDRSGQVLVAGAGGFIGGHLIRCLRGAGFRSIRAVDVKPFEDWHQHDPAAEEVRLDLSRAEDAAAAVDGCSYVFNLAADMGGMGFIERNKARCMLSVLINTHLLQASLAAQVERFFFSSSACVYAADKQTSPDVPPLKEDDAYPAMPEDGYGWEKLFSERMCRHFSEDFGLATRVARYHNVYGPHGTWTGGREKAPAAICRKVAEAKLTGDATIEIWGDGTQTRSFMYADDCVYGTMLLMEGDATDPINVGSSELVSINQLVDLVADIAGVSLEKRYLLDAPKGVNGRNSDNTKIRSLFGWEPSTSLQEGLETTYQWVYDQVAKSQASR
jgi:nucleoside-diphosphate-sugar epimerase